MQRYVAQNVVNIADVQRELRRLQQTIDSLISGEREIIYAAPARPQEGQQVVADGTGWNPGSGAGTYEYLNGAWVKL